MPASSPSSRPRFYGRRVGKALRPRAVRLMETLLPRLAIPEPEPGARLDPFALFSPAPRQVWLEVGFGGGEHLAWQAGRHPDIGFIGCEPFLNGVASLLRHVEDNALSNIRVFPEDARRLFPALPDASLGRVFVLHPDPWPKKRHAARRFIGPENLDRLARLMAPGAELRIASDDPVYIEWTGAHLGSHRAFCEVQTTMDRNAIPDDWPPTRYEAKARREGRAPVFFRYARTGGT